VFRELLLRRAGSFCELSPEQVEQLEQHYQLMVRWNKVINLTRIEDVREVVDRHYGESLFLGANLPPGRLKVADIGSGAGFPGLPIAVLRPELHVSLIESHQRKAVFLKEAARGISNISVISRRAEDISASFDWVVSRAVSWDSVRKVGMKLAPNIAFLGSTPVKQGLEDRPVRALPIPWDVRHEIVFHAEQAI
jgi:16S rRNA (guanine527-N7)-methyltransferase